MRLFPRLLLSVSIPLAIVAVAMTLVLVSMNRMTSALAQLRLRELSSLDSEAELHSAGWRLDVALRHAAERCARDPSWSPRVRSDVLTAADELRQMLDRTPNAHPNLTQVSERYVTLALQMDTLEACGRVTSGAFQARRSALDEELTNVWVDRMAGLHDAIIAREEEMRSLGNAGVWGGLILFGVAFAVGSLVSLALARSVTAPLVALTRTARKLGEGELGTPVRDVGGPAELVEFGGELESMRRRLAELDALKQGFIASCSHELRTPLSKMREALALLADGAVGALDARQLRVVAIARTACERQIRTVTSILDLSRLRAGSPLRVRHGTPIDGVIDAALEQEGRDAKTSGVELAVEREGPPALCDLDDALVEHALANLVRNAVAVSPRGSVVTVARQVTADRRWVSVDVRDTGPGVPADLAETIFEPFVTRSVPRSPKSVGVGLGLSLAREVAEAHGGTLTLESSDEGSVFRLTVPCASGRGGLRAPETGALA